MPLTTLPLLLVLVIVMPYPELPLMTLRWPAVVPPMTLAAAPALMFMPS